MKESYVEGLASYGGPESCVHTREGVGEALVRGTRGPGIEPRNTIEHDRPVRFIEHRVADARVVRLIKKWLRAGVLEDGRVTRSELGTVQGGSISPLLANIYLHYAFDLWAEQWRGHHARGEVIIVRYADDWPAGFQFRDDPVRFQRAVTERLEQFGLRLHETKTRLIEFGRFARGNRGRRGQGKPQTFDWKRMYRLIDHWLPRPHICHPYPNQRLIGTTQGPCAVAPHARICGGGAG